MKASEARALAVQARITFSQYEMKRIYDLIKVASETGSTSKEIDSSKYSDDEIDLIIKFLENDEYRVKRIHDSDIRGDSWDFLKIEW